MKRMFPFGTALLVSAAVPLMGQQFAPATRHSDVSVSLRVGTLGPGLEVAKLLTGHVAARIGGSYFKISTNKTQSNISYDASLKLHSFSALIDLYPGGRGSFHLTGGVVTNPLTISATGVPAASDSFKINGKKYSSAQVGTLSAEGTFPGASAYAGLGFGTPAAGRGLEFLFDLGAVIGKPTISLNATGPACAAGTACAADLKAQQDTTQHDLRKYLKVYPVLALGLGYRF